MQHTIMPFLFLILFFSGCCSWDFEEEDFEFSQEELNHFGPYKVGDTVYFRSTLGDLDTITVVEISEDREEGNSCFISLPPSNYRSIAIKHLPRDHWRSRRIGAGEGNKLDYQKIDYEYQNIISIGKHPLRKETNYDISFRDFWAASDSTLAAFQPVHQVAGCTIENCYRVAHGYPERISDPDDIEVVYWTDRFGLTAYTNMSGETWFVASLEQDRIL